MKTLMLTLGLSIFSIASIQSQCGTPSTLNWGYDDVNQNFVFTWDKVPGSIQYKVSYWFDGSLVNVSTHQSNKATIPDLNTGVLGKYRFEVRANCGGNGMGMVITRNLIATVADVRAIMEIDCENPESGTMVMYTMEVFEENPYIEQSDLVSEHYYSTLGDMCDCVEIVPPGEFSNEDAMNEMVDCIWQESTDVPKNLHALSRKNDETIDELSNLLTINMAMGRMLYVQSIDLDIEAVTIYDLSGQSVLSDSERFTAKQFDLEHLSTGIYVVEVVREGNIERQKVFVP